MSFWKTFLFTWVMFDAVLSINNVTSTTASSMEYAIPVVSTHNFRRRRSTPSRLSFSPLTDDYLALHHQNVQTFTDNHRNTKELTQPVQEDQEFLLKWHKDYGNAHKHLISDTYEVTRKGTNKQSNTVIFSSLHDLLRYYYGEHYVHGRSSSTTTTTTTTTEIPDIFRNISPSTGFIPISSDSITPVSQTEELPGPMKQVESREGKPRTNSLDYEESNRYEEATTEPHTIIHKSKKPVTYDANHEYHIPSKYVIKEENAISKDIPKKIPIRQTISSSVRPSRPHRKRYPLKRQKKWKLPRFPGSFTKLFRKFRKRPKLHHNNHRMDSFSAIMENNPAKIASGIAVASAIAGYTFLKSLNPLSRKSQDSFLPGVLKHICSHFGDFNSMVNEYEERLESPTLQSKTHMSDLLSNDTGNVNLIHSVSDIFDEFYKNMTTFVTTLQKETSENQQFHGSGAINFQHRTGKEGTYVPEYPPKLNFKNKQVRSKKSSLDYVNRKALYTDDQKKRVPFQYKSFVINNRRRLVRLPNKYDYQYNNGLNSKTLVSPFNNGAVINNQLHLPVEEEYLYSN